MNKVDETLNKIDRVMDKKFGRVRDFFGGNFAALTVFFLVFMTVIFVVRVFYGRPMVVASIIEDDLKIISLALDKIDAKCNILTLEDDHSEIDFLNVEKFSGSQVGPIGLAYPDKWEGPYLQVNPSLQGIFYEIVKAKDGVFVVPGRGVRLPNGLVVGKAFTITPAIEVGPMLKPGGALMYENTPLAVPLVFKIGDWDTWHFRESTVKDLNRMLKEFDEALPYTCNDTQRLG